MGSNEFNRVQSSCAGGTSASGWRMADGRNKGPASRNRTTGAFSRTGTTQPIQPASQLIQPRYTRTIRYTYIYARHIRTRRSLCSIPSRLAPRVAPRILHSSSQNNNNNVYCSSPGCRHSGHGDVFPSSREPFFSHFFSPYLLMSHPVSPHHSASPKRP